MKNSWNKLLTLAWIVSGSSVPKSQFFSNVNCWLKTEFKHSARMQKYPLGNLGNALLSATDLIYNTWSLVWMQNNFSSNLRVHFKVKFNPNPSSSKPSSSPPPPLFVRFSPTVKAVKPFLNLSQNLFWSERPMDLWRSWEKWGKCHLPTWLCLSPWNLQNPACAMMRDFSTQCGSKIFRSPWILLLTSHNNSFQTTSDDKSGYGQVSVFRQ